MKSTPLVVVLLCATGCGEALGGSSAALTIDSSNYAPLSEAPCDTSMWQYLGEYSLRTTCGRPAKARVEVTNLAYAESFPRPIAVDTPPETTVGSIVGEVHVVGTDAAFWNKIYLWGSCESGSAHPGGLAIEINAGLKKYSCFAGINSDEGETEPCARADKPDWPRGDCSSSATGPLP